MSETAQRDATSPPAARLGGELRTRRQSLGWELPQLAQSLRIRQSYLEAIEAGRMAELPGTTYALGFVRAYASALGLNGEQIAGRFRAESSEADMRPALSFPAPVPQRGVPAGALMLLGLVILGGTYAGWYYVSEHQHTPAETVPPIPDHLLPRGEKPAPSPQVASILPGAAAPAPGAPPAAAAAPVVNSAKAVAHPAPASPTADATLPPPPPPVVTPPPPSAPASPVASGAALPAVTGQPGPEAAGNAQPAGTRIVVKANADAWVTVKQLNGPAVLNKLMHAGDTWPVPPDKPGLTLTTGNAGGTELDVDATQILVLGGSGAVRRDLKLDADALKAGPLPPIGRARAKPVAAPPPA